MMRSLAGQRVVVTRAIEQAEELAQPLRELGAEVLLLPTIAIAGAADPAPLREAAAQCDSYDWVIFSSANAVLFFAAELPAPRGSAKGTDARRQTTECAESSGGARDTATVLREFLKRSCRARIATIGAATCAAAEKEGFTVSLTPGRYIAESLAAAFTDEELRGRRILIPSAAVTRDVLPNELRQRGATVDVVEAYRNVRPSDLAERAAAVFREPYPDWATFTSSSSFENLLTVVDGEALRRMRIATIGPITSETVRKHGFTVAAEANPHTVEGLVGAVCGVR